MLNFLPDLILVFPESDKSKNGVLLVLKILVALKIAEEFYRRGWRRREGLVMKLPFIIGERRGGGFNKRLESPQQRSVPIRLLPLAMLYRLGGEIKGYFMLETIS